MNFYMKIMPNRREFDKNKYVGKKIESIVKAGKGQQLRQLFGEPDYS